MNADGAPSGRSPTVLEEAVTLIVGAILDALEADPHQWSTRGCQTCRAISALAHRDFGCVKAAKKAATR